MVHLEMVSAQGALHVAQGNKAGCMSVALRSISLYNG